MSRVCEYKDSTVDGAINKGLADMGLTREQVEVTVLKTGGFLTKACVSLKEIEIEVAPATAAEEVAVVAEEVAPVATEEVVAEAKPAVRKKSKKADAPLTEDQLAIVADVAEKSNAFITTLMSHINPTATVEYKVADDKICIDIHGEEAGKIIGYRGETLDALQYLTLVCCNKQEQSFVRYNIDVNGYRKKRAETLTSLARKLARNSAKTGKVVELEPMSALERRIIHTALMDDTFVKTESVGEGKFRHINIVPNRQNKGNDRFDRNNRNNRNNHNNRRGDRPYNSEPREYVNKYDEADPIYTPKPVVEEVVEPTTFGTTSDFRKKGAGKTRSFGAKNRRF